MEEYVGRDVRGCWGAESSAMVIVFVFFFQAEDGIRDLVRSRGLGDVYKRQQWWGYWACCHWRS